MKRLVVLALWGSIVFGQSSLYTYIQTAPGQPWQWGRLILDQRLSVMPASGSPCKATEPCFTITFPPVAILPPGTACKSDPPTLMLQSGSTCYPIAVVTATGSYFVVLDPVGITYLPKGYNLSGVVVPQ